MNTTWKTGAFSKNSTPVAIDDALLDEKVVILLQGKNVFGDQIYTYIRLSLRSLQQLRDKMKKNENFMPAEYGEILAAGRGEPSAELRSEMAVTYNMIDVPRPKQADTDSFAMSAPKLWDD